MKATNSASSVVERKSSLRYTYLSLFLSIGFYAWWALWAFLQVRGWAWVTKPLLGLPLWFWLSSVLSLPLLFGLMLLLLPSHLEGQKKQQRGA